MEDNKLMPMELISSLKAAIEKQDKYIERLEGFCCYVRSIIDGEELTSEEKINLINEQL